jgi:hypothetical protein
MAAAPATSSEVTLAGAAADHAGNLRIADHRNDRIRMVTG